MCSAAAYSDLPSHLSGLYSLAMQQTNLNAKRENSDDHFEYEGKCKLPQSIDSFVTDRSADEFRCNVCRIHVQLVVTVHNIRDFSLHKQQSFYITTRQLLNCSLDPSHCTNNA